jgi:hypothetical protein
VFYRIRIVVHREATPVSRYPAQDPSAGFPGRPAVAADDFWFVRVCFLNAFKRKLLLAASAT